MNVRTRLLFKKFCCRKYLLQEKERSKEKEKHIKKINRLCTLARMLARGTFAECDVACELQCQVNYPGVVMCVKLFYLFRIHIIAIKIYYKKEKNIKNKINKWCMLAGLLARGTFDRGVLLVQIEY